MRCGCIKQKPHTTSEYPSWVRSWPCLRFCISCTILADVAGSCRCGRSNDGVSGMYERSHIEYRAIQTYLLKPTGECGLSIAASDACDSNCRNGSGGKTQREHLSATPGAPTTAQTPNSKYLPWALPIRRPWSQPRSSRPGREPACAATGAENATAGPRVTSRRWIQRTRTWRRQRARVALPAQVRSGNMKTQPCDHSNKLTHTT